MALEETLVKNRRFDIGLIARLLVVVAVFVAIPLVFSPFLASQIIVLAIVAIGYNLLLGYGGELSFGHAAFYGGGAYMTVLYAEFIPNLYVDVVLATITIGIVSMIFGAISLRRRGLYFAMITLALSQMVYTAVNQVTSITGGANGLLLPIEPGTAAIGPLQPLQSYWHFYILGLVVLAVVWLAVYRITRSPFGRALMAIRESEDRARHLGYSIDRLLLMSFTMSGLLAGLAGAMYVALFAFISPNLLFWSTSGEIVILVILGGVGTLGGPVVGAIVFGILSENLSSLTENWPLFFGAIFVAVVMLSPQGLYGLYEDIQDPEETPLEEIREILSRIVTG